MAGAHERPQAQQAFDVGSWPAIRQSAAQLSRNRDAFVRQPESPRRVRRLDLLGECPAWDEQRRTTRVS